MEHGTVATGACQASASIPMSPFSAILEAGGPAPFLGDPGKPGKSFKAKGDKR